MSPTVKKWIALVFFALFGIFLYVIHEVLLPFILSGVFIYLLAPLVNYLSKQKILKWNVTRGFSVIIIYIYLIFTVLIAGLIVFPPLYQEILKIAKDLPGQITHFHQVTLPGLISTFESLAAKSGVELDLSAYLSHVIGDITKSGQGRIQAVPELAQHFIRMLFAALSSFLVMFIVTAFVLIDLPKIQATLLQFIPVKFREPARALAQAIDRDLSGSIRGQLLICLINGTLTTIGFLILKVKFAFTMGIVAGIFSLIPVFGALFSTIPAVLIAATQSWLTVVGVIGLIIIIHLIEANFLNPKIMGHTVELHPSVVIFSIMVGEHFLGPIGLLFGVPMAAVIRSLLRYGYRQIYGPLELVSHAETAPDVPIILTQPTPTGEAAS